LHGLPVRHADKKAMKDVTDQEDERELDALMGK
jgi:hypothetical protein